MERVIFTHNSQEAPVSARILWVDDVDLVRSLCRKLVENLGHFADTASNGKEALELLKINRYDILITDIEMPEMDGWQLAEAIKGEYGNMKVVIVTGWRTDVTNDKKKKYGINYVLGKPIERITLKNLIEDVLRSKE